MWNPHKGDILEVDSESGEVVLEGDIEVTVPSVWNMYIDPDAYSWEDCRYVFEKRLVPYEDAIFYWPEHEERLEKHRSKYPDNAGIATYGDEQASSIKKDHYDSVEVYEYWDCLLYTSPSPRDGLLSRMPSSA